MCAKTAARAGESTPQDLIAMEEQPMNLTTVPSGLVRARPAYSPRILLSATSINGMLRSLQSAVISFLYAASLQDWDKTQICAVPRSSALTVSKRPRAKPSLCKESLTTSFNASNGVYWVAGSGATTCCCSLQEEWGVQLIRFIHFTVT